MERVKSFTRKEIIGREEKYLIGRGYSELENFYKENTVLSRRNYSWERKTLNDKEVKYAEDDKYSDWEIL